MTVIGPRAAIPSTGETRSEIRGEETLAASSGRRPFPGFFLPCPSDVEWSSCMLWLGAGAVLGPFEAVGERGGDVAAEAIEDVRLVRQIHGYHLRGSRRQAEGDGEAADVVGAGERLPLLTDALRPGLTGRRDPSSTRSRCRRARGRLPASRSSLAVSFTI